MCAKCMYVSRLVFFMCRRSAVVVGCGSHRQIKIELETY